MRTAGLAAGAGAGEADLLAVFDRREAGSLMHAEMVDGAGNAVAIQLHINLAEQDHASSACDSFRVEGAREVVDGERNRHTAMKTLGKV